jgi:hypothetical protein
MALGVVLRGFIWSGKVNWFRVRVTIDWLKAKLDYWTATSTKHSKHACHSAHGRLRAFSAAASFTLAGEAGEASAGAEIRSVFSEARFGSRLPLASHPGPQRITVRPFGELNTPKGGSQTSGNEQHRHKVELQTSK